MPADRNLSGRTPRLHVEAALDAGAAVEPSAPQVNYLLSVLRLDEGDAVLLFNGRDGEWLGRLAQVRRRHCRIECETRVRPQTVPADLQHLFAPLKHARLDYLVQKAAEMGVGMLRPVLTERTVIRRVNLARMRANAVEAAEQCHLLSVPEVREPEPLGRALEHWDAARRLVVCDETAPPASPLAHLERLARGPLALLTGPEGGFTAAELARLRALPFAVAISLGPRILRADTAAVAALALLQATLGDWRPD
jgi:16S rRNA (uracil1498-N3)-methyltransferase